MAKKKVKKPEENLASIQERTCAVCGKPVKFWSENEQTGYCSDSCYDKSRKQRHGADEAHIHVTKTGETFFKQGDIMFSVDPKDLNKVVGSNGESNVLDKLMDSQIASLAVANGLPIQPFARDLLVHGGEGHSGPLTGIIQIVWYRDLEKNESDHLNYNQQDRITHYLRMLSNYKAQAEEAPKNGGEARRIRASADKWVKTYKVVDGKRGGTASGRELQVFNVLAGLKQATFTQIVEAAKGKVETKQPLEKIVNRFLTSLVESGSIQEVK